MSSHQSAGSEEGGKTILRKPYTLTKQREAWTPEEHVLFIEALQLFNRDWKKIEAYIGTKTVVQIRSHAQKWFQKNLKSGNSEAVPPARPKRKTAEVPQAVSCQEPKSLSNSDVTHQQQSGSGKALAGRLSGGSNRAKAKDTCAPLCGHSSVPGRVSSNTQQHLLQHQQHQLRPAASKVLQEDAPTWAAEGVVPNLHLVYSYLGSLFDPEFEDCDHLQALQDMQGPDRLFCLELMDTLTQRLGAHCHINNDNKLGAEATHPGAPRNRPPKLQLQDDDNNACECGDSVSPGTLIHSSSTAGHGPSQGDQDGPPSGRGSKQASNTALLSSRQASGSVHALNATPHSLQSRQSLGGQEPTRDACSGPACGAELRNEEAIQRQGLLEMDMDQALMFFDPSMDPSMDEPLQAHSEFQECTPDELHPGPADQQWRAQQQQQQQQQCRPSHFLGQRDDATGRHQKACSSDIEVAMDGCDGTADLIVRLESMGGREFCSTLDEERAGGPAGEDLLCELSMLGQQHCGG